MEIKMLETRRGTEDGFSVALYKKGSEYEVREHLARTFFAAGFAIPTQDERVSLARSNIKLRNKHWGRKDGDV